jgi:hypothetical protein
VKKRFGIALAAGALLTALWAGTASAVPEGPPEGAAGPPIGGCPTGAGAKATGGGFTTGWGLVQPSGPEHLSAQYDFNGDGWVCRKASFVPAFGGDLLIAFMDNVVR